MIDPYRFGTATFDPATIFAAGDMGGFWDFTDASTIYADTARTTLASLDGPALGVTDKSGKGYHLTGNATVRKVGYVQTGTNHFLEIGSGKAVGSASGLTAYMAFQLPGLTSHISLLGADRVDGARVAQALLVSPSGILYLYSFYDGGSSYDYMESPSNTVVVNTNLYASVETTATTLSIYKNGASVATATTASRIRSNSVNGYIGVGVDMLGTSSRYNQMPSACRLYAALFINRPITSQERTDLNAWFANRAGV